MVDVADCHTFDFGELDGCFEISPPHPFATDDGNADFVAGSDGFGSGKIEAVGYCAEECEAAGCFGGLREEVPSFHSWNWLLCGNECGVEWGVSWV